MVADTRVRRCLRAFAPGHGRCASVLAVTRQQKHCWSLLSCAALALHRVGPAPHSRIPGSHDVTHPGAHRLIVKHGGHLYCRWRHQPRPTNADHQR